MFCREVKTSISLYLDGQLDELVSVQVEEHVAGCPPCRHRLGLMQEIPAALQTNRMLAPRPEFTKMVMQRIIVRQQVGTSTFETRLDTISYQTAQREPVQQPSKNQETAETEDEPGEARLIHLAQARANRLKTSSQYLLRFSSAAAALVMLVGVSVFIISQNNGQSFDTPTAAVYGAISGFADTLRNALNSPFEVVAGVAIAALVLISLWYLLRALHINEDFTANDTHRNNSSSST